MCIRDRSYPVHNVHLFYGSFQIVVFSSDFKHRKGLFFMQKTISLHGKELNYRIILTALATLSISMSGCGNEGTLTKEPLGSVEQDALGINALGVNALGVNALGVNALGVNALGVNALGVNALGVNGLNWMHESSATNSDRVQLLKYLAKCALGPTQYLAAHAAHAGCVGHPTYYGIYGLAPNWPTQGMTDLYEQRWVTACVLAHVNQKGTPQAISLRCV